MAGRGRPIGMGTTIHQGVRRSPKVDGSERDLVLIAKKPEPQIVVPIYISNISASDPARITTSSPHGLTTGDEITVVNGGGMVELEGDNFFVSVISDTEFDLYQNTGLTNDVNSAVFSAYVSGGFFTLGGTGVSDDGEFVVQASSPTATGDFGYAIAMTTDYAVIGEPGAGKAYVQNLSTQVLTELVPSGGAVTDKYGRTVAIDGNQIMVQAMSGATANATVYVFDTDGNQQTFIDDATNERFGFNVEFTDNHLVISATDRGTNDGGLVYFYNRTSPYALAETYDFGGTAQVAQEEIGTSFAKSPDYPDMITAGPGSASPARLIRVSGGTGQSVNYLDTNDNTANIWSSHADGSDGSGNGPTSVAMSKHHIFIGVPNLNRVAVWRYADPLNGNYGTLGASLTTPAIDGNFTVSASGNRIDLGAEAPNLVAGTTDLAGMGIGTTSGFINRASSTVWNSANGGIAWIRNKDTNDFNICRFSRDTGSSGTSTPDDPTAVRMRAVNFLTNGEEPASFPAVPGYTTDGNYNLQISMIAQYSHRITITGQSGETDIDFGRQVYVTPDSQTLYVAAPLESWSGENRGTIYRFSLNDTTDEDFETTLAADTIATLNGYYRGEVGDYLGSSTGSTTYFFKDASGSNTYTNGQARQISGNGTVLHIGNSSFDGARGRVLGDPQFTAI